MKQATESSPRNTPIRAQGPTAGAALFCLAVMLSACEPATVRASPPAENAPRAGAASAPQTTSTRPSTPQSWVLAVTPGENGTYRIHVADPSGRERQVLEGPDRSPPYMASELVQLEDYTGDGRPDILAHGHSAGASPLTSDAIYVYDAASGRFLDAEVFENEGEVTRTRPGCIAVEHRNPDNMTYAKDAYCWKGTWVREGSAR